MYIESVVSLLCPQETATSPYPEPHQSSPHTFYFLKIYLIIVYYPVYTYVFQEIAYSSDFTTNTLHAPLFPKCSICSKHFILLSYVRCTVHEAYHSVVQATESIVK